MHELIELLSSDMKPALGVTEPGAIAYAVSTACSYLSGRAERVDLRLNSGIYKNAFTCGIPNSTHLGNLYAAALGAIAANPALGLECLSTVTPEDNTAAETMIKSGAITAEVSEISSRIHIEAMVYCGDESATVIIRDMPISAASSIMARLSWEMSITMRHAMIRSQCRLFTNTRLATLSS